MTNEEAKELIAKYNAGECTEEEKALLEDWYMQLNEVEVEISEERLEQLKAESLQKLRPDKTKTVRLIRILSATAAIIFFFLGNYFYFSKEKNTPNAEIAQVIKPGSNRATLLSNGKLISLSDAKTGVIIDANELIYNDGTNIENQNIKSGTQTLTTPKGGQYQLAFKDGTKIWLNAASTLSFKTNDSSPTREVSLIGEAYFEIAKNKSRPFKVLTNGQVIEVLGTHFNVTAYKGDHVTKTTLVEGSVKVNDRTLKPGEQSTLTGSKITVQEIDPDNAIAWKNGEFMFFKEPLSEIMPKLARWYDVEISYQNTNLAHKHFSGTISKFENIAEVLNMLTLTGEINFKIEGRRVFVMP